MAAPQMAAPPASPSAEPPVGLASRLWRLTRPGTKRKAVFINPPATTEAVSLGTLMAIGQMLETDDQSGCDSSALVFLDEKTGHILIKKDNETAVQRISKASGGADEAVASPAQVVPK